MAEPEKNLMGVAVSSDITRSVVIVGAFLAVPVLSILAYIGWDSKLRRSLPRWRSLLGLLSLIITCDLWLFLVGVTVVFWLGLRTRPITRELVEILPFAALSGVGLSGFLKGRPRLQAIAASLLMGLSLFASAVS